MGDPMHNKLAPELPCRELLDALPAAITPPTPLAALRTSMPPPFSWLAGRPRSAAMNGA
jgi:hypothetical protein